MTEFIILIASLMSIVALSIDAMLPALGYMGADLGITHPNQAQYIISFIFIGMTIGQLVCGPLSDAIGRKKILYGGLALYAAGSLVSFYATTLEMMLLGRLIQGLGVSGPYVAAVAIVRDKFAGPDMARIMSLVMVIFILVPAIAPTLGQAILLMSSWHAIFLFYIAMAAILTIWLHFRLEETLKPENRITFTPAHLVHGFKEIMKSRVTVCYMICMGICFGSLIGYLNSSQQIFQVQFETGKAFTLYFGGLALVLGVASLLNSRIVAKYGMQNICIRSTIAIIAASALFMIVNLTMVVELWMFMVYAAIIFFSFGLMFGNLNAIAMEPMGHIAGIASAVIGATSSMISLILGIIIGQFYDNTLIPVVTGFLVFNSLSLIMMIHAKRAS